jgi:hypothetical protein
MLDIDLTLITTLECDYLPGPHITVGESTILVAGLGIVAAWLQSRHVRDDGRSRIKQDLKLLSLLPSESNARDRLVGHIDNAILRLVEREDEHTRDWLGIPLATFFVILACWSCWIAFEKHGPWLLLLVPALGTGVFGIAGLGVSIPKKKREPRDKSTHVTKPEKSPQSST